MLLEEMSDWAGKSQVGLFFSRSVFHQRDFRTEIGEGRDGGGGKGGGVTLLKVAGCSVSP